MAIGRNAPNTALITGVSGQDGTLLAQYLAERDYTVHGTCRPGRTAHAAESPLPTTLMLHELDLADSSATRRLVSAVKPGEVYNLAAQSAPYASWDSPGETIATMTGAATSLLEAIRTESPASRFFQASSSEIFRGVREPATQDERTRPEPVSPYGVGKLAVHNLVGAYRARYGLFACSGILYNHESHLRPTSFVTRKIVHTAVRIARGEVDELVLGDTAAERDWSYAGDVVRGIWLALQREPAEDYVFASGRLHKVQDWIDIAFGELGLDPGKYVRTDQSLLRHGEDVAIAGDSSRARSMLGWEPELDFEQLVTKMLDDEQAAAG